MRGVPVTDGLPQRRNAEYRSVFRAIFFQRLDRGALDVFRRRKIRLAGAEVGHVNSLRLQPLRFLQHDHRLRNADAIHAVCKVEYLFHFSPGGRFH